MSNWHLKDKNLTLKAKGLLSMMLSLPDEWNYTTRGLAAICKEGVDSIGSTLRELEETGYLSRRRLRDDKGKITDTEYTIYERPQKPDTRKPDIDKPNTAAPDTTQPHTEKPYMDEPDTDEPYTEKPAQSATHLTHPARRIRTASRNPRRQNIPEPRPTTRSPISRAILRISGHGRIG